MSRQKSLSKIAVIAFTTLVAIFIGLGIRYFMNVRSTHQIRDHVRHQLMLSNQISMTFLAYEQAIDAYQANPDKKQLQKLDHIQQRLNQYLDTAVSIYGLSVKRWVDLFKVWQIQLHTRLNALGANHKKLEDTWGFNRMTYQILIRNAMDKASQDYKNISLDDLLYVSTQSQPSRSVLNKTKTLYNTQAKALMPASIAAFQQCSEKMSGCIAPELKQNDPKSLADTITFIQYTSRFCPYQITNRYEEYCATLRRIPKFGDHAKRLDPLLAACKIADQREQQEAAQAAEKYGKLTYAAYFQHDVKPLIDQYRQALKSQALGTKANHFCDPKQLPVVRFRDPKVDAKLAAYEMYGYQYCHAYFANSQDPYENSQYLRYSSKK